MKPISRMLLILLILSGCSRIIKEEPYTDAKQSPTLKKVEGLDMPVDSGQLTIPEINSNNKELMPDANKPPEMSFAKKRSDSENVVIIDVDGVATMEIFNNKDAWELMTGDFGDHWQIIELNEADCQVTLYYKDPIIKTVKDQGFFKKLFTFKSRYIDRSGQYVLTCLKLPQKQQIWVQTTDFQTPSAFVIDDLFNSLFIAATE